MSPDSVIVSTPYPGSSGGFHLGPSRSRNRSRTASRSRKSRSRSRSGAAPPPSNLVDAHAANERAANAEDGKAADSTDGPSVQSEPEPETSRHSTVIPIVARALHLRPSRTGTITIHSLIRRRGTGSTAPIVPVPEEWDDEGLARAIIAEYARLRGWALAKLGARSIVGVRLLRPSAPKARAGSTAGSATDDGEAAVLVVPPGHRDSGSHRRRRSRRLSAATAAYTSDPHALPDGAAAARGAWPASLADAERTLSDLVAAPRRGRDKTVCVAWLAALPPTPDPATGAAPPPPPALPVPPLAVEVLTGWRPGRILAAWVAVLAAGALAYVLWVLAGVGGRGTVVGLRAVSYGDVHSVSAGGASKMLTSNPLVAVDDGGWRGAGARVEAGGVLALFVVLFGGLGIVGWGWVSWAVG